MDEHHGLLELESITGSEIMELKSEIKKLKLALLPFAKMHRPGCDLSETCCIRGVASDMTMLFSEDFYNASEALGIPGDKEAYEDFVNDFSIKLYELKKALEN